MNWQPLGPSPFPLCRVLCCKCGKWEDSLHAAADLDGEPFIAYHCWQCQTPDVRERVRLATEAAFLKLPPAIRDSVRVRLGLKPATTCRYTASSPLESYLTNGD